jgi:hypothetical protein
VLLCAGLFFDITIFGCASQGLGGGGALRMILVPMATNKAARRYRSAMMGGWSACWRISPRGRNHGGEAQKNCGSPARGASANDLADHLFTHLLSR